MSAGQTVHRLQVTLQDIDPPVWRRIEVRSDATLEQLHHHIQTVFGWFDAHLHEFEIGDTAYGIDDGESDEPVVDESEVRLVDVAPAGTRFTYVYDFGDDWQHTIEVEAVEDAAGGADYPRCTAGEREAPPEDVGGPWSYPAFVAAITDPAHPDHADMIEWHGRDDFDPEHFDLDGVNAALLAWRKHAPPHLR